MIDAHIQLGFPIESVKVWSRSPSNREEFAKEAAEKYRILSVPVESPSDAVKDMDIVCCCSPSLEPRVMSGDVGHGLHINAFGADSPGKQEVDPSVLTRSKIVVDSIESARLEGKFTRLCNLA
jgi:alanine dehydrogenase